MGPWPVDLFISFTNFYALKNQKIDCKCIEDTLTKILKDETLWRLREVNFT
jgi:hypothetical protein